MFCLGSVPQRSQYVNLALRVELPPEPIDKLNTIEGATK